MQLPSTVPDDMCFTAAGAMMVANSNLATAPNAAQGGPPMKGDKLSAVLKTAMIAAPAPAPATGNSLQAFTANMGFSPCPVMLPAVYVSDALADVSTGQVKTFKGDVKLTMTVGNLNALAANPKAKAMFAKAFAQTIGFDEDEVLITSIEKSTDGGSTWTVVNMAGRRLASHAEVKVKVNYEVLTTDTTKTLTAASFDTAALKANIAAESAAIGTPVTITAVEASAPTAEVVGTAPKGSTGSSSRLFFHLFAAMLAAGVHILS